MEHLKVVYSPKNKNCVSFEKEKNLPVDSYYINLLKNIKFEIKDEIECVVMDFKTLDYLQNKLKETSLAYDNFATSIFEKKNEEFNIFMHQELYLIKYYETTRKLKSLYEENSKNVYKIIHEESVSEEPVKKELIKLHSDLELIIEEIETLKPLIKEEIEKFKKTLNNIKFIFPALKWTGSYNDEVCIMWRPMVDMNHLFCLYYEIRRYEHIINLVKKEKEWCKRAEEGEVIKQLFEIKTDRMIKIRNWWRDNFRYNMK
jgi:hypothetical protein